MKTGIVLFISILVSSQAFARETKKVKEEESGGRGGAAAAPDKKTGSFLPDWPTPEFDFNWGPILGFQALREKSEVSLPDDKKQTIETSSQTFEVGLQAGLKGLPLAPGNPGAYLEPYAGYAYGGHNQTTEVDGQSKSSRYSFSRYYLGASVPIYAGSFRQLFKATFGFFDAKKEASRKSIELMSDSGVLLFPFLGVHYTYNLTNLYYDEYDKRLFTGHDNWWHARLSARLFDAYFDFGPGWNQSKKWSVTPGVNHSLYDHTYFRARSGADFLWWLHAEADTKYILDADSNQSSIIARERLPSEALSSPSRPLNPPKDSLLSSFFVGVPNVMFGIGVGWRYNLQVYNLGERNGKKRETKDDNSIGVFANVTF